MNFTLVDHPDGRDIYLLQVVPVTSSKFIEGRKYENQMTIIENARGSSNLQNQHPANVNQNNRILHSIQAKIQNYHSPKPEINIDKVVNQQERVNQEKTLECQSESQPFKKHRTSTDVLWLFFFLCFAFTWLCIGIYVGAYSKTTSFLSTYNRYKEECHLDDKKYLMYFDLVHYFKKSVITSTTDIYINSKFCKSGKACVSECPSSPWTAELFIKHILPFNYSLIKNNLICLSDYIKNNITSVDELEYVVNKNLCLKQYSLNFPVINLCLPFELLMNFIQNEFKWNLIINIAEFIYLCALEHILYVHIVYILTSLLVMLYVCLLRWLAEPLMWFSTTGFFCLALTVFIYAILDYFEVEASGFLKSYKIYFSDGHLSLIIVILAAVLLLFIIIKIVNLIRLRHHIQPGLILIKESCTIVLKTNGSLIFIFLVIYIYFALALWTWNVVICLVHNSNQDYIVQKLNKLPCNCTGEYQNAIEGNKCLPESFAQLCTNCICSKPSDIKFYFVMALRILNIFAVVWTALFVYAFSKMVLVYSVIRWCYAVNKRELPTFLIATSTRNILRYHMGTAANGSFGTILSVIYKIFKVLRTLPYLKQFLGPVNINASPPVHKYSLIICVIDGTDLKNSTEKINMDIIEDGGRKGLIEATRKMLDILKWMICLVLIITLYLIPHEKTMCLEIANHYLNFCIYLISTVYLQVCKIVADSVMYCYFEDEYSKSSTKKDSLIPENLRGYFKKQESSENQNENSSGNMNINS